MAKTSKIVPQKEKASSSRPSDDKAPVEPSVHDYVPGPCILKTDFKAISRFQVDLSQCEAELQKVSGEIDALRLLCSQKDEAIKDLQADLAKVHEEGVKLDKQAEVKSSKGLADKSIVVYWADAEAAQMEARAAAKAADTRAHCVKQKGSVQAKKIEELETRLAEAKAKVESSKVLADKSIAIYRANAEAAQIEARATAKAADTRAHWVAELAKCRSRRETLEKIHG
ncbi:microtubule-associated protein 70-2-like [Nicotiana tomentosiformis]|uniref:microtubule-associated protein 70-2-like n=1 Tax=Nicotiana tomentosiformis TaxID=4098 RepID=UPI00388C6C38